MMIDDCNSYHKIHPIIIIPSICYQNTGPFIYKVLVKWCRHTLNTFLKGNGQS